MIGLWLKQKFQRRVIKALVGHDPVTVGFLMYRAGLLSDLASAGKFAPGMKPLIEAQIRCVRSAILSLEHGHGKYSSLGRKPGFRNLEASFFEREGICAFCARSIAKGARTESLLDADTGFASGYPSGDEQR